MRRQAGGWLQGRHAGRADGSSATDRSRRISVKPEYDKAPGGRWIGFSYGTEPANLGVGAAISRAGDCDLAGRPSKTVTVFAKIFDSEQRKEVSGIVGVSDVAHQTIERRHRASR